MSFLLDTNACSAVMKLERRIFARHVQHAGRLFSSSIVLAELYAGAYNAPNPTSYLEAIEKLLLDLIVLGFDDASAQEFGRLNVALKRSGVPISTMDLLIASTTLAHGLTLVTHNT